jgi:hypothetical protein
MLSHFKEPDPGQLTVKRGTVSEDETLSYLVQIAEHVQLPDELPPRPREPIAVWDAEIFGE